MTSPRRVWIVGAGERVRDAFLPVLAALEDKFSVQGLLARSSRELTVEDRNYAVHDLESFSADQLQADDLVVICVSKASVPDVLGKLTQLDVGSCDLLIDTPVVRFRWFHHWKRVLAFRNAWVAEDCAVLPWIDVVRRELESGRLGKLQGIHFEHSAYAYHAIATAKAIVGESRLRWGKRVKAKPRALRTMGFREGVCATVSEPCSYAEGQIEVRGSEATLSDHGRDGAIAIEPLVDGTRLLGFRVEEREFPLTELERSLAIGDAPATGIIARQSAMKRVGLARLFLAIREGAGAYSISDGLDDMVVDYHLEKFGRYRANPFTSFDSTLARVLLSAMTRIGN